MYVQDSRLTYLQITEAVQVVVDASKHAQAEVDVHVRMWFGDDGDMVCSPY